MIIKTCIFCRKQFTVSYYRKDIAKYCSRKCANKFRTGIPLSTIHKKKISQANQGKLPKNHFKKGHKHSESTKRKISKIQKGRKHLPQEGFQKGHEGLAGKNNSMWKNDQVGYGALHDWVRRYKGKPLTCEHCGKSYKERKLHWANKSHTYKRDLTDWLSLCVPCHSKYDNRLR